MPRSIWNGTITFGLLAVPIKVHSAVEDHTVHFHQVHAKDGVRIKQRRVCTKEGKEVPYHEVAMGYQTANGEYVVLTKDEIAAAAGERAQVIELEEFVGAPEIDPVHYDRSYYRNTGKDGEDAEEYLAIVQAPEGALALTTMRFADEGRLAGRCRGRDPENPWRSDYTPQWQ